MSATTKPAQRLLERMRHEAHPSCLVCSRAHDCAMGLRFALRDDGGVEAEFTCSRAYEGYPGVLHGGVISALLDGAMTNCLFARGIAAVTADAHVRFRHPVRTDAPALVSAEIVRASPPLYVVEAQLRQDGQVKATATGKFMQRVEDGQ